MSVGPLEEATHKICCEICFIMERINKGYGKAIMSMNLTKYICKNCGVNKI